MAKDDKFTTRRESDLVGDPIAVTRDRNGDVISRSREESDLIGDPIMVTRDRNGDVISRSRKESDMIGDPITVTRGPDGDVISRSRKEADMIGDPVTVTRGNAPPFGGGGGGGRIATGGGGGGGSTGGADTSGGSGAFLGTLIGIPMMILLFLTVGPFVLKTFVLPLLGSWKTHIGKSVARKVGVKPLFETRGSAPDGLPVMVSLTVTSVLIDTPDWTKDNFGMFFTKINQQSRVCAPGANREPCVFVIEESPVPTGFKVHVDVRERGWFFTSPIMEKTYQLRQTTDYISEAFESEGVRTTIEMTVRPPAAAAPAPATPAESVSRSVRRKSSKQRREAGRQSSRPRLPQ